MALKKLKIFVHSRCSISTIKKSVSKADTWHGYCSKRHEMLVVSIPLSMKNRRPSGPIGSYKNAQWLLHHHGFEDARSIQI